MPGVKLVLVALIAFLLGSLVMGVLYSRWRGEDIRGRDLPGGSGTFRQYGKAAAVGVTLADALKGAVAVLIARWIAPELSWAAVGGVVLGHCYPLFFGFRGGGGIAPLIGAMLVAAPVVILGMLAFALAAIPPYRRFLQPRLGLNAIPFATALSLPVGLALATLYGGVGDLLAGGAAMGLRAVHLLRAGPRA
ncbi:glycerol-3-phosphate acyltransferase [uncultured Deinococcus sp.]|uniref:glycerol-3-phosphate acyltransferase n=1 Tax=uncultured Deinococcus sp. TaxID=158789 RepID=UPI002585A803|nr:glycerol-3-phosphate acyltransferase [uncultured Deinococcus sp.]